MRLNIFRQTRQQSTNLRLGAAYEDWFEVAPAQSSADCTTHYFVALQPVLTSQQRVYGYETLYRAGRENRFTGDHNAATQTMIDHWVFGGLGELIGEARAFVNCTRQSLTQMAMTAFPTSVILEVVETIEPDRQVLKACHKLKDLGYQLALDDFQLSRDMEALLEIADYVKVDFRLSNRNQRREICRRMERSGGTLIAEKIETREEYEVALAEGFSLFQGYYLARPKLFCRRKLPTATEIINHCRLAW